MQLNPELFTNLELPLVATRLRVILAAEANADAILSQRADAVVAQTMQETHTIEHPFAHLAAEQVVEAPMIAFPTQPTIAEAPQQTAPVDPQVAQLDNYRKKVAEVAASNMSYEEMLLQAQREQKSA